MTRRCFIRNIFNYFERFRRAMNGENTRRGEFVANAGSMIEDIQIF